MLLRITWDLKRNINEKKNLTGYVNPIETTGASVAMIRTIEVFWISVKILNAKF